MTSRIIVKNLPKKISEEKFQTHFSKIGEVTDVKLKYTKEGKFRQFGFIGFKTPEEASKAIDYFNNTFIDASRIVVETCKPLNDPERGRPWSKHSKDSLSLKNKTKNVENDKKNNKNDKNNEEKKKSKKEKKLERLVGDLNEDEQFKEFLAANKAIKSKENIWKNDFNLNLSDKDDVNDEENDSNQIKKIENKQKRKDSDDDTSSTKNEAKESQDVNKTETLNKKDADDEEDFENGRLFIRNLCYTCKEEDLEKLFEPFAPLVEVNMPIDSFSKKPKGFAYITCMFPEKALKAFNELDGTIYQGRMLHIIPAKNKREENELGENAKFKDKKLVELKKKSQSNHNWNTLFINQDSVANLMASKYNVDKSEIFDVHSTGKKSTSSVAVKLAVGETQIVNDIRKFLIRNGVKLDALNDNANTERSKTAILLKNLPNNTNEAELRDLFTKVKVNGAIKRFVMPDYGIAALIEFNERQEARDAFKKLAYRKFKNVPLYLEWAPVDIFDVDEIEKAKLEKEEEDLKKKEAKTDEMAKEEENKEKEDEEDDDEASYEPNATLYVKNLNFDSTEDSLQKLFSKIGKCKASIARKISPNKESLSMGYGFVKFKKASDATEAIKELQNHKLDGHNLELKFSNRTADVNGGSGGARKNIKQAAQPKEKSSKILVRNIPFEAKTKEIEELFRVFGELKYCRLPKKIDGAHRGFGFVDFVTISDAQRAFEALSHSTHLFGRRLVLEWAQPEQTQDVEILRLKEEQLAGPSNSKKLKKSKIIEDLGGEEDFSRMDVTDS